MSALTDVELRDRLTAALGVTRWIDDMAARAPFDSLDALVALGRRCATPLTPSELDEAVSHHPRIGERPTGDGASARLSEGEQGALGATEPSVDEAIAQGNVAYEERFGRVFLIRAAGRSRPEVLSELMRRLDADEATEADEAAEQLRQIMELRLRTLFADGGAIS